MTNFLKIFVEGINDPSLIRCIPYTAYVMGLSQKEISAIGQKRPRAQSNVAILIKFLRVFLQLRRHE